MTTPRPTAVRPGLLRRLFAAVADRCRITRADLPARDPVEVTHWEAEQLLGEREVMLPRTAATTTKPAPVAAPAAVGTRARASAAAVRS